MVYEDWNHPLHSCRRRALSQTSDPDVLAIAANLDRVLVSHDLETLPGHFYRFIERHDSPGVIMIPQLLPIGRAIEDSRLVWGGYEAEEFTHPAETGWVESLPVWNRPRPEGRPQ